jgi:hypothetical protein
MAYLDQPMAPMPSHHGLRPQAPQFFPAEALPILQSTSFADPILMTFLVDQWGSIFQRLGVKDIENICRFCEIKSLGFPEWFALLETLVLNNNVRGGSVEEDMAQIFQAIGRNDLFGLARGSKDQTDGSISLDDLILRIRQLAGKTLFLVDDDSIPNALSELLEMHSSMPKVKLPFLMVPFVAERARFKSFQIAKNEPWFAFVHTQTKSQDAADRLLTIAGTIAHLTADLNSTICLVSEDDFACKVEASLGKIKFQQEARKIRLLNKIQLFQALQPLMSEVELDKSDESRESYEPNLEERFQRFLRLIYDRYVVSNIESERLSALGLIVKEEKIFSNKGGLRPFIDRGVELKFLERQGSDGNAAVIFSFDAFQNWYKSTQKVPTSTEVPRSIDASSQLPQIEDLILHFRRLAGKTGSWEELGARVLQ